MKKLTIVLVALLLVACGTREWHHTNPALQTNDVFARDQADCIQHARALQGEPPGEPGDQVRAFWQIRFNLAFNNCMETRGWYRK